MNWDNRLTEGTAIRLSYFQQVAPLEYLRHVTMELGNSELSPKADPSSNQVGLSTLIDRFSEVSTKFVCV